MGKGGARSLSKLLHARYEDGALCIEDRVFYQIADILRCGDLLVLNNSQVMPCRYFVKVDSKESLVEILLVKIESRESKEKQIWQALAKPMRALKVGANIKLADGLFAKVLGRSDDRTRIRLLLYLEGDVFDGDASESVSKNRQFDSIDLALNVTGYMPIPPYIRNGKSDAEDAETYQTVYAKAIGSIACPTAGLHFTDVIFDELKERGVQCEFVTLHVGTSSFLPVKDLDISSHQMEFERYSISAHTVAQIVKAKKTGRRIVAVGTTSVRALESAATAHPEFFDCAEDITGSTDLFITPGYKFKIVDSMITNFHQPCSTHLLLVAAFFGESAIDSIYNHALKKDYRFLSYGDAMFLDKPCANEF